ncbi:hypothetical protein [Neobacillus sp. NPDC093127]|uniref:hypothetical protein n=1 Tax=Neobacillus sp. NPDC093127 TaxID=3364296 RepID=UPI0038148C79
MEPEPSKKPWIGYPIGSIGARSTGKVTRKVSNRAYWSPNRQKSRGKGIQSAVLEPVQPEK